LIYGNPVPGYQAPVDRTGDPGGRVSFLLLALLVEAQRGQADQPLTGPPAADFAVLRDTLGLAVGDDLLARGFLAFTALFGLISFELFGQYQGSLTDRAGHFDHQLRRLADMLGL
jgi:hypothetical protein